MKKVMIFIAIILIVYLIGIKMSINNTTSYISILEKGNKGGDYWAIVQNPFDPEKKKFKIKIDSKTTWNLLIINEKYLATYEYYSIVKDVELVDIAYGKASETKSQLPTR